MNKADVLKGKRILVVDDEPDVLESIEELLDTCSVDTAGSYSTAAELLQSTPYDMAILDIMGVQGYDLLKLAKEKGIFAVMLTGHALSADNFAKSMGEGADAYLPKGRLVEIDVFLADVFNEGHREPGRLGRWFERLKNYYEKKFGPDWLEQHKGAWY